MGKTVTAFDSSANCDGVSMCVSSRVLLTCDKCGACVWVMSSAKNKCKGLNLLERCGGASSSDISYEDATSSPPWKL